MGDFTLNPLLDPARKKRAALSGAPGTDNYTSDVANFNNWLYTPMDRRPTPAAKPALSNSSAPGWHGPSSPVAPGAYQSQYGTASVTNPTYSAPATGGIPTGLAGPNGIEDSSSIIDTAPRAVMPNNVGAPTPPQNAMQRWSGGSSGGDAGGMMPISNARRYFWATGNIDARAPQADPTTNKGAISAPTFNNEVPGHSNWQPGQAGFTFNGGGGHSQWSPW